MRALPCAAARLKPMSATLAPTGNADDADAALQRALDAYLVQWPDERRSVDVFAELLALPGDAYVRERLDGHLTASGWLVDRSGNRVLLTHHRKLERWLQLGGHADGDRVLADVALREAQEESGLTGLSLESSAIFDLDHHWIPARREVPGHWHYDVRYVVRAGDDEAYAVSDESLDLAWRDIAELAADASSDTSVQRMARKWLARRAS